MLKIIKFLFWISISSCVLVIAIILGSYLTIRPSLPEISLVDEAQLQMPLKVYTEDKALIGEFGEIKRRPIDFVDIPPNIKNAFLAAEDDQFFNHQGISYTGLIRSVIRCLGPRGCFGGGGTISMQVVRGYLLTRDQTIVRKVKEIFLALELEGKLTKEEIFELYVNRNFFGNRSYGIEAAANTYFNKSSLDLTLAEAATIAAMAQSPSRINAIKAPERTKQRRNWILSRMLQLRMINEKQFDNAIDSSLIVSKNIDLYDIDGKFIAELARQEIISRYGLMAYKNGWSVFTTINSKSQQNANTNVINQLAAYDKRHGWKEAQNFADIFTQEQLLDLDELNINFISDEILDFYSFDDESNLSNRINIIFENFPFYKTHSKGIVINVGYDSLYFINEDLEINSIPWSSEYDWARKRISINEMGPKPNSFKDFLMVGDFVYFKKEEDYLLLDQIPEAESAFIAMNPVSGAVKAYIGGTNFNKSNFDRVRL